MPFPWSEDSVADLTRMWNVEGKSASEIARILGRGATRNAVIGKVHRLGLAQRGRPARLALSIPKREPRPFQHRSWPRTVAPAAITRPAPAPTRSVVAPAGERKTIVDLGPRECGYGVEGEGADMLFCAAPVVGRSRFCACHGGLTHLPTPKSSMGKRDFRVMATRDRDETEADLVELLA